VIKRIGQRRRRIVARGWVIRGGLVIGALPLLLPLVWMVSTSLKKEFAVFEYPPQLIPKTFEWRNYVDLFTTSQFGRQYASSIYIAILTVIGTAVVASLAGYALARLRFPGRRFLLPLVLTALLLPIEVIIVPLYVLTSQLGWVGTQIPLVVEPVFGAPAVVGTFLMRQFFLSLPRELEDAGQLDGLSRFGVFRHIALPLARPAIATLAVLTFLASWNAFLEPLVFTAGDPALVTIPVGLALFTDSFGQPVFNLQMAATTLSIVPVLAVFLLAQRHIVEGIARSGLKG
jgi:multiple sugar transport system permease protein